MKIPKNSRPIPGFLNYRIKQSGRIWSIPSQQWLTLKVDRTPTKSGKPNARLRVRLYNKNVGYSKYVHRLVWEAWKGPIPEDMIVDHIDEDKLNPDLSNLQLLTHSQNCKKAYDHRPYN